MSSASHSFGIFLFIAQYLQLVLGLSPLRRACGTAVGRRVRRRFDAGPTGRTPRASGAGDGWWLCARCRLVLGCSPRWTGLWARGRRGRLRRLRAGSGPGGYPGNRHRVGRAPPERAGAASGISETSAELGGALGIALLGSIGTAVYRSEVAGAVPGDVPPASASAARDTLGGAVAAAEELPDPLGGELLDAAREAFALAFDAVASISAMLAIGVAILAIALLRPAAALAARRTTP